MKRTDHTFQFTAKQIGDAAAAEADYHEGRIGHWQARADAALETVKATIGAKVVERQVTGGQQVDVIVDYGDPEAWREYQLATTKVKSHRDALTMFEIDAATYGSQSVAHVYELDGEDVRHFRLGGEPRED